MSNKIYSGAIGANKATKLVSLFPHILTAGGVILGSCFLTTIPAQAFIVQFGANSTSSNSPATGASANVEFTFSDLGAGLVGLDLTLTNTTGQISSFGAGATEATLVGFGFDITDDITGGIYDPLLSPFTQLYNDAAPVTITPTNGATDEGLADLPPFGTFEIGIRSEGPGNFTGGNPQDGITAGQSTNVFFQFNTLLDAAALETAFLDGLNDGTLEVATRFQQVNAGEGSDKLLGGDIIDTPPPKSVPEPATLLGLAVIGGALKVLGNKKSN
jgi:hypothetical protein